MKNVIWKIPNDIERILPRDGEAAKYFLPF